MSDNFVPNDPFGAPGDVPEDDEFDIDVSGAALLPPGDYEARVLSVERGDSKTSGNPQLIWDFLIVTNGKTVKAWTALTPGSAWKITEFAAAFGLQPDPVTNRIKFNKKIIIGAPCTLTLEHSTFNGVKRESVKKISPRNGATIKESSDIPF